MKIPGQDRAQFYAQLAVLEDAGVPISRALVTAVSQGQRSTLAKRVKKTNAAVSKGVDLADAGSKAKLFDDLDASLVRAATSSGKLGPMLHRLAEFHRKRAEHIRTLKGQLLMPALVLILAIFIRPAPALILGRIDFPEYLSQTLFVLIKLVLLIAILLRLPSLLRSKSVAQLGLDRSLDRLVLHIPVFGKVQAQRCVNRWFESMTLLQEAGVPILQGMVQAGATIGNSVIQKAFTAAASTMEEGESLTQGLSNNRFVSSVSLQFIRTGEESGRLAEMLGRCARRQREELRSFDREFFTWAPRIIYFLILIWMAVGIIQSGGGLPRYDF